jgi:hypothetical protein
VPPGITTASTDIIINGVAFHPRVITVAQRHRLKLEDLADAFLAPEASWPGLDGTSTVHLRGPVAVVVSNDTDEIFAVTPRTQALKLRQQPRHGAVKRTRGGSGGSFPTNVPDLLTRAKNKGLAVEEDRRHFVLTSLRFNGVQVVVPRTPSDFRALPNTCLEIRRRFNIDLRS